MRKILAVAGKELRQASRDPISLTMLLIVPAMMLLLYGFALNFDVRHVDLDVQDLDRSAASRDLIASFVRSTYFNLAADLPPDADLHRLTEERQAWAILVIPPDYGRNLAAGRPDSVQFILDGTDSNTATTILGYATALVQAANARLFVRAGSASAGLRANAIAGSGSAGRSAGAFPGSGSPGLSVGAAAGGTAAPANAGDFAGAAIDYRPRVWFNPDLKSARFLVPGLIGFILMLTAVLSTALSVVREQERGTMEQLLVTPLRPQQLLLGKTAPYLAISLAATAIILIAARVLFGVEVRGSYPALLVATLLYLFGALGYGLLVSSFARTQAMAHQVGALTSILPALYFSGFIFPIRSMPLILRWLTYAVPARYYLVILRGIILKGTGLGPFLKPLLFLALYAAVVQGVAWFRLTRCEEHK